MRAHQLWLWLLLTGLLTIGAMVVGAAGLNQALAVLAAGMFAVVAGIVGWCFAGLAVPGFDADALAARFARLLGTTWCWAGLAMLGCYYLTDLSWQHAWQYGAGMLLIAAMIAFYAHARAHNMHGLRGDNPVRLARLATRLQGYAALAGVIVLALSGKLDPAKPDWAANIVFVAGGLAIFGLSSAALRAEARLVSKHPTP